MASLGQARRAVERVMLPAAGLGLRAFTAITDLVPARLRFGHWNDLVDLMALPGGLPEISPGPPLWETDVSKPSRLSAADLSCVIVAGELDSGGVETVVATLALGLPEYGVAVEVVCTRDGRTADSLRERGVTVSRVSTPELVDFVRERRPDTIELHRINRVMLDALAPYAERTVPVFHAMESYLDEPTWEALRRFSLRSPASIAVSGAVAEFFRERVDRSAEVVLNGVPAPVGDLRSRAPVERARLGRAIGVTLGADVVVVALQRFSDQKNAAGLVDAFLLAAESDPRLRLVVAGAPNSWLEVRRADVLRRTHPCGDRVHLLGDSDPAALLLGGDLFALDSFAEGGPVAAVEAVACGLPVVLSDVGFARELVATSSVPGRVVRRANETMAQSSLAAERRRRHQSNRAAFAAAIRELAAPNARDVVGVPEAFTRPAMVAGHARVLRRVAAGHRG